MNPIKTALIGFGISGRYFQTPVIQSVPTLELTAVVSSNSDKVKAVLPQVKVYSSIENVLTESEVELVVIATPNEKHYTMAAMALRAGKHVVVEKPFVINSASGERLIQLAKEQNKLLTVYQSRRFDGDFVTIKKLMDKGKLGEVHTFISNYNRYRPHVKERWRERDEPGSGILYDLGSHLIDQALQLFGMPDSVDAHLRNQRIGTQAVDHFHLILSYPTREVILHGNCLSTTPGPRFQVFGDKGSFIKYGMDLQEDLLRQSIGPESLEWGVDKPALYGCASYISDEQPYNEIIPTCRGGYEQFYLQVADAIRAGSVLPVLAKEALAVIEIIEAAYRSDEQERRIYL